jgi:hypothetical protein
MTRLARGLCAVALVVALALPAPARALEKATIGYNSVADFILTTATVDASQIRYWVDIMRQQKMLTKAIDPASVMVP